MYFWMAGFAVGVSAVLLLLLGPWHAGGFAAGAALSVLNFHWLKAAIDALAAHFQPAPGGLAGERAGTPPAGGPSGPPPGRGLLLAKFFLRYALIVLVGYGIFRSSLLSLSAFLGGLFVFVAGVLAEMIYELATGTGSQTEN